jgi:hypothetical protein
LIEELNEAEASGLPCFIIHRKIDILYFSVSIGCYNMLKGKFVWWRGKKRSLQNFGGSRAKEKKLLGKYFFQVVRSQLGILGKLGRADGGAYKVSHKETGFI